MTSIYKNVNIEVVNSNNFFIKSVYKNDFTFIECKYTKIDNYFKIKYIDKIILTEYKIILEYIQLKDILNMKSNLTLKFNDSLFDTIIKVVYIDNIANYQITQKDYISGVKTHLNIECDILEVFFNTSKI